MVSKDWSPPPHPAPKASIGIPHHLSRANPAGPSPPSRPSLPPTPSPSIPSLPPALPFPRACRAPSASLTPALTRQLGCPISHCLSLPHFLPRRILPRTCDAQPLTHSHSLPLTYILRYVVSKDGLVAESVQRFPKLPGELLEVFLSKVGAMRCAVGGVRCAVGGRRSAVGGVRCAVLWAVTVL